MKPAGPMVASQRVGSASRRKGRSAREGATALHGRCSGSTVKSRPWAVRRRGRVWCSRKPRRLCGRASSRPAQGRRCRCPSARSGRTRGPAPPRRMPRPRPWGRRSWGRSGKVSGSWHWSQGSEMGTREGTGHGMATFELRLGARLGTYATPFVLLTPISRRRKRAG